MLSPAIRKSLLVFVKLAIMALFLALVLKQVHWYDYTVTHSDGSVEAILGLASCLSGFELLYIFPAIIFLLTGILITAYRWRLLMQIQDIDIDRASTVRLKFLGEFCNNFLLGALGGDVVKAFYVLRHSGKKGATVVSIFADRFAGLCILTIISLVSLCAALISGGGVVDLQKPVFSILFVALGIVVVLAISLSKRLMNSTVLNTFIDKLPFSRQINVLRSAIHRYQNTGRLVIPIILYSVIGVTCWIVSVIMIGSGLQMGIPWHQYFLYLPLIFILAAVPVTPGGIGVIEELFIYFFSSGADPNKILAMVILYRIVMITCGIPGAMVMFFSRKISDEEIDEGILDVDVKDVSS